MAVIDLCVRSARDPKGRFLAGAPLYSPRQIESDMRRRAKAWKAFRAAYLYSQPALAQAIGASRRTVQYVEAGQQIPQPRVLKAFADLVRRQRKESAA